MMELTSLAAWQKMRWKHGRKWAKLYNMTMIEIAVLPPVMVGCVVQADLGSALPSSWLLVGFVVVSCVEK